MKKILLSLLVISMPFAFSACDDDDDDNGNGLNGEENSFTYDGENFAIDQGLLLYFGIYNDAHDFDLIFHCEGISFDGQSFSGRGDALDFLIYSDSGAGLSPGTYNYGDQDEPFYFVEAEMLLDYDIASDSGTEIWIEGGSLEVDRSGNVYTIDFNVTAEDGKPVRGSFEGPIQLVDFSKESAESPDKRRRSR